MNPPATPLLIVHTRAGALRVRVAGAMYSTFCPTWTGDGQPLAINDKSERLIQVGVGGRFCESVASLPGRESVTRTITGG
jgi:hypothetical protein